MARDITAYVRRGAPALSHDPAGAAIVIMLYSQKMPGMTQAVQDLKEQFRIPTL